MSKNTIALFNYGGGMRGLIPAHIMTRIEEKTGLHMTDMVDIFSGPSTGAILNAALNIRQAEMPSLPRFQAKHMVKFYEREGDRIFPPDQYRELRGIIHDFNNRTLKLNQLNALVRHGHYDPGHLARALKALYGDAKLSNALRSLIIPCYNIDGGLMDIVQEVNETGDSPVHTKNNITDRGGYAVWMKHIKTGWPQVQASQTPDVSLYDAVMASCAAPTYFPCHHFSMKKAGQEKAEFVSAIDGNMFDNPCISYLGAIRQHIQPGHKLTMIVLGTGFTNRSIRRDEWNRYGSLGVVDPVNDLPLINIFFHAPESALMETFAEEMGENLIIFNKAMNDPSDLTSPSGQIDDASPENLKRLRDFSEALMEENAGVLDTLCHTLATRRDQRKRDEESLVGQARKYLTFFKGLQKADRSSVADHEAQ